MGENHFATIPVAFYGVALLMLGVAYYILTRVLIKSHPENHSLAEAVGKDTKGILSVLLYSAAISLTFIHSLISIAIFIIVALMWLVPDKLIERVEKRKWFILIYPRASAGFVSVLLLRVLSFVLPDERDCPNR